MNANNKAVPKAECKKCKKQLPVLVQRMKKHYAICSRKQAGDCEDDDENEIVEMDASDNEWKMNSNSETLKIYAGR